MNIAFLIGNLGRDPEVKYLDNGSSVTKFSMACRGRTKDDPAEWYEIEMWGKLGQVAADYARKGSKVGIVGQMKTDKWTDKQTGEARQKTVVNATGLELLDSKNNDTPAPARTAAPVASRSTEEVPF